MSHRRQKKKGKGGKPQRPKHQAAKPAVTVARAESRQRPASSRVIALRPMAPIIVRSGRPFDGQTGADEARFPPPSTVAGCLRTAWARATGRAFGTELLQHGVRGPLPVRRSHDGSVQLLVPRPADALYTEADAGRPGIDCRRLEPRPFPAGVGADLPDGLLPVQLTTPYKGKPVAGPDWWSLDDFLAFRAGKPFKDPGWISRGWTEPPPDIRAHVAIDRKRQASRTGQLFQTAGLDCVADNLRLLGPDPDMAADIELIATFSEPLAASVVHLGGERRLAKLQPLDETALPPPPEGWLEAINKAGGLSLTLLTPGAFSAGYRPGWLDPSLSGVVPDTDDLQLTLVAVAIGRWQPHSGWDLAARAPRQTRKLAAAGTTYWFRLMQPLTPGQLDHLWLRSIADREQDRRDSYALALPAPWTPPTNH